MSLAGDAGECETANDRECNEQYGDIWFGGQPLAEHNPATGAWTDYIYDGSSMLAEVAGEQTASPLYNLDDQGVPVRALTPKGFVVLTIAGLEARADTVDQLDVACKAHDQCYADNGFSF